MKELKRAKNIFMNLIILSSLIAIVLSIGKSIMLSITKSGINIVSYRWFGEAFTIVLIIITAIMVICVLIDSIINK